MAIYSNPDDVRSDMVRSMLQWWLAKSGGDIPDRDDLDPVDLKPLLPNILISDVEHDPFRIRYRLVGTRAREEPASTSSAAIWTSCCRPIPTSRGWTTTASPTARAVRFSA